MRSICFNMVLLIAAIGLAACASSQVSDGLGTGCTISVRDPGKFPSRLAITRIDTVSTEPFGGIGGRPPSRYSLAPGHHTFSVRYTKGTAFGYEKVEATLEQGHNYTLCSESEGLKFTAWLIDDATGASIEQKQKSDWKKILFGKLGE